MTIHDDVTEEGAAAERLPQDEIYADAAPQDITEAPIPEDEEMSDDADDVEEDIEDDADEDLGDDGDSLEDESEAEEAFREGDDEADEQEDGLDEGEVGEELDASDDEAEGETDAEADGSDDDESASAPVDHAKLVRMVEAILFASAEPVAASDLKSRLPDGTEVKDIIAEIQEIYEPRGVHLVQVAGKWAFRTANDLGFLLHKERVEQRKLSRAAIETLAIIAYHQPVTRAEIEQLRGVTVSKGTLDVLLDIGWVRMRGRRETPGRPLTYGTTDSFLEHFGLATTNDLPGMEDLKAAGLLSWNLPADFSVPTPPAEGDGDGDGDFEEEESELPFHREDAAAMTDEELFEPESDEAGLEEGEIDEGGEEDEQDEDAVGLEDEDGDEEEMSDTEYDEEDGDDEDYDEEEYEDDDYGDDDYGEDDEEPASLESNEEPDYTDNDFDDDDDDK